MVELRLFIRVEFRAWGFVGRFVISLKILTAQVMLNLLDGSVEFLAEGELKEVESFIETVDSKLKGYWNHKSADKRVGLPQFQDFLIRY